MKRIVLLVLLVVLACKEQVKSEIVPLTQIVDKEEKKAIDAYDISLEIYDYDGLEPLINKVDEKIHVVNFWATWCAPCVKELPYFEEINANYNDRVEVLLVSLDFPRNYDSKLKPFMKKHNLKSKVIAFDDIDQNRWIPAINKNWTGALPATILYNKNKRQFYEQSFTKEELEIELKSFFK